MLSVPERPPHGSEALWLALVEPLASLACCKEGRKEERGGDNSSFVFTLHVTGCPDSLIHTGLPLHFCGSPRQL